MNAQTSMPAERVTVGEASAFLTANGDPITPSNVSRYLARFPQIPQEKKGKFRYVDPLALKKHRDENVLVGEKQSARGLTAPPPFALTPATPHQQRPADIAEDLPIAADPGSPLQQAALAHRKLQIRELELNLAEREGHLVPDQEVLALVTGAMQALIGELERQESDIAGRYGREVAAEFRKARKAAQARASARLIELARQHLPPALALAAPDAVATTETTKAEAA